jgi:hypothetical protein
VQPPKLLNLRSVVEINDNYHQMQYFWLRKYINNQVKKKKLWHVLFHNCLEGAEVKSAKGPGSIGLFELIY